VLLLALPLPSSRYKNLNASPTAGVSSTIAPFSNPVDTTSKSKF